MIERKRKTYTHDRIDYIPENLEEALKLKRNNFFDGISCINNHNTFKNLKGKCIECQSNKKLKSKNKLYKNHEDYYVRLNRL